MRVAFLKAVTRPEISPAIVLSPASAALLEFGPVGNGRDTCAAMMSRLRSPPSLRSSHARTGWEPRASSAGPFAPSPGPSGG